MQYTLQSEKASVVIASRGGEVTSFQSNTGLEYIWQADPVYWASHAPHLFPYVGRLTDGQYKMDGQSHPLGIHGFFRFQELSLVSKKKDSIVLSFEPTSETKKEYDRNFLVHLRYTLTGMKLRIDFKVENLDSRTMYFSYGGHPGFNIPLENNTDFEDYYLEFSPACTPISVGMTPSCYVCGDCVPFTLEDNTRLPLTHNLFDHDAIVLEEVSKTVSLHSKKSSHGLTVTYPQMPILGLWQKPYSNAPYLCIEPWTSLPSRQDIIETFEEKEDLIMLEAGNTYTNSWSIEIF